ncbi:MAG: type II secretion system GspH family protein [Oligoflexia bacterium]|nr:type II secretion system GspH family protein [Oligoflexia bacterium]
MNLPNLSNRRAGFTLIEILIAFGVLGTLSLIMLTLMTNLQKDVRRLRDKGDRSLASYYLDQVITTQDGVRSSAELLPANEALRACVIGGAVGACTSDCCKANIDHEFILLDPRDLNSDPAARAKLSGKTSAPLSYNLDGTVCQSSTCAYSIGTAFNAHCPGGATECDHAEHLVVKIAQKPLSAGAFVKTSDRSLIYFVNVNYRPFIAPIAGQALAIGAKATVQVLGNSGHPSEVENFVFDRCESSATSIVKLTCYGFVNGGGTVQIEGLAAGTSTITLSINDGQPTNNISPAISFVVTVN